MATKQSEKESRQNYAAAHVNLRDKVFKTAGFPANTPEDKMTLGEAHAMAGYNARLMASQRPTPCIQG